MCEFCQFDGCTGSDCDTPADKDAQPKPEASPKLAEGEYRVGHHGGCPCIFIPDGRIMLLASGAEETRDILASLLNRQAKEIRFIRNARDILMNDVCTAVNVRDSLQAQLTTAQERVGELEGDLVFAKRNVNLDWANAQANFKVEIEFLRKRNSQLREAIEREIKYLSKHESFKKVDGEVIEASVRSLRQALSGSDSKGEVIEGHDMEGPTREFTPKPEGGRV